MAKKKNKKDRSTAAVEKQKDPVKDALAAVCENMENISLERKINELSHRKERADVEERMWDLGGRDIDDIPLSERLKRYENVVDFTQF